jgi:hypothetical protein
MSCPQCIDFDIFTFEACRIHNLAMHWLSNLRQRGCPWALNGHCWFWQSGMRGYSRHDIGSSSLCWLFVWHSITCFISVYYLCTCWIWSQVIHMLYLQISFQKWIISKHKSIYSYVVFVCLLLHLNIFYCWKKYLYDSCSKMLGWPSTPQLSRERKTTFITCFSVVYRNISVIYNW